VLKLRRITISLNPLDLWLVFEDEEDHLSILLTSGWFSKMRRVISPSP
jgi:hypothetical protein